MALQQGAASLTVGQGTGDSTPANSFGSFLQTFGTAFRKHYHWWLVVGGVVAFCGGALLRKKLYKKKKKVSQTVHRGITCSNCGDVIRGNRYMCANCKDQATFRI